MIKLLPRINYEVFIVFKRIKIYDLIILVNMFKMLVIVERNLKI